MSVHLNWSYVCNVLTDQLLADTDFKSRFADLTNNADRVGLCLSVERVRHELDQYLTVTSAAKHRKHWEKAKEWRTEGNHHFKENCLDEAIDDYNQAITMASIPTQNSASESTEAKAELSLALANRSAVFYRMKQYDNCLSDISDAFKYDYPLNTFKLLMRRANCLIEMNRFGDARHVLESNQMKDKQMDIEVKKLLQLIDSKGGQNRSNCLNTFVPKTDLKFVSNQLMPNASQALKMCVSPTKGRYIVAKHDIQVSDVLFIERPYASVLLPQYYNIYCHHCYGPLMNKPVKPCNECTQVRYCDDNCRDVGWDECHRYECGHLDLLHDIGIAHLAFRILLVCGVDNAIQTATTPDTITDNQSSSTYLCDYQSVYALVDHSNNLTLEDSISYSLVASLLLLLTQKLELIAKESQNCEILGGIVLKHISQLITNGHSISSVQHSRNLSFEDKRIATAIYPTVSLMNHSCDPNVIPIYDKNLLIVRAAKPITKGQQVMNCYGPHCKRMSTKDRQSALLLQYFFKCDCSSCLNASDDTSDALMCNHCNEAIIVSEDTKDSVICKSCHKNNLDTKAMLNDVQNGLKLLTKGSNLIDEEKYTEAEVVLLESLAILEKVLYPKNRTLGKVKDELSRCYARLEHWSKAVQFGRQSLAIVGHVFGHSSVEMSNELIKLSDLQYEYFNTGINIKDSVKAAKDCLITTSKAIKLLNNYSLPDDHNSPNVMAIKQLEERLISCNLFVKQFAKN